MRRSVRAKECREGCLWEAERSAGAMPSDEGLERGTRTAARNLGCDPGCRLVESCVNLSELQFLLL